jgi:hypothetical protein
MVMSISVAKPRNTCIRCGGAEFRELEHINSIVNKINCAPDTAITTYGGGYEIQCEQRLALQPAPLPSNALAHVKF